MCPTLLGIFHHTVNNRHHYLLNHMYLNVSRSTYEHVMHGSLTFYLVGPIAVPQAVTTALERLTQHVQHLQP